MTESKWHHSANRGMKTVLILSVILSIVLMGCARGCAAMEKEYQTTQRVYIIEMFSGGKVIYRDSLKTIINDTQGGGIYYSKGDTLIELGGDYIYKSVTP